MSSKIKINPVTNEIEIEVSDEFLMMYFKMLGIVSAKSKRLKLKKIVKKTMKSKGKSVQKLKKGEIYNTVIELIRLSKKDRITVDEIMESTKLDKKQIYAVVNKGKKNGVVKSSEKGVYEYVK